MNPWLVVACPGSRADELAHCLGSLQHPPERTMIVGTAKHDPIDPERLPPGCSWSLECEGYEPSFSLPRLWNTGLREAYRHDATHVAVFASDVVGHPGSIPALAAAMWASECVMGGPTLAGGPSRILGLPRTAFDRVPGACFMLRPGPRLLCDESYRWWYGDDDLEMQARQVGQVGIFAGTGLALSQPDSTLTEERQRWAVEDRARFVAKWKVEPW